ncbi:ATP-binding protein [Dolichospermum sp. ST_con]|nr:ATP-binding protein [Dolichospermum sp. ST_con]MDD1421477.1 ATP-binding protein [Dolichospermum sp. ST_sed1]MDD1425942.1 ATP-binding protein [Dolichospermum sp. ST_sed9]MDD1433476.1 ATP-binding protein [Dolichospermum sp. ST_sed6]MDD1437657.1 ATP-binding protein [Dolichospermum sp. ST_sed10]MDD1442872.1 ATP-binding protein [Dolichospermum sp. ST_sed3]MDD1447955.1 ATP-binding protein [Dolichospermum sp. ST_sed8]MDD1457085.1 ATP-binding protein [Dolichospermum sp. ST_sed7]MDD1462574.1 ATP-
MTITANTQFPHLIPQNLEFLTLMRDSSSATLGAELVYTQDSSGRYLTFYWQHSEYLGCDPDDIVDVLNENDNFAPVDKVVYLEHLHRILSSSVPERVKCWFKCPNIELLELELTITPILPRFGQATTTVLVIGRLLPSKINPQEANQVLKPPTALELALRLQRHQKLLNRITRNIRRTLDLDIIWQQTVDSLGKKLNLERCIICPYQPSSNKVRVIAEYCRPAQISILGSEIDISSESSFAEALATLEPVVMTVSSNQQSSRFKVLVVATGYKDQVNSLVALSFVNPCHSLTQAELELAKEVADQLGTAIAHATLYKEIEESRQKAEEVSRLKTEFLANVSHEIRTPLNGMIGFLKLILEGITDDAEEQHEFISEAHQLSLHLLNILNDILDIAKIEAGKMELDCSPVNLKELFDAVEGFTRRQAEMKNLSFQMEMPAISDEIIVQGNYQRLLQVMLNLVGNAIKFTHEGGITISADLMLKKHPGIVKVRVADTGIGVSLDKQDKLFQLFSQIDGSRTRHYGGTGLGLTISQKLIEAMGGEVHFYSLGEELGSTVTFTVPLYQQPLMVIGH